MTTNTSVRKNKIFSAWGSIIGMAVTVVCAHLDARAAQAPVPLGSASTFAILAGSTVTSTGGTTVNGDLGISPGTALTGAPTVTGTTHLGDPAAAQAQLDLTTAYNDAAGRTVGAIAVAGNLGGQTLTPGLYKSTSSLEISSGDLTLDAQGDANAVFIFQMGSTLTTTAGRQVILSGGAQAANIVWQVGSSATLGTTSVMKGNILALASITVTTGAAVEGRLLARTAAVTLDANTVGLGTTGDTTPPTVSSTDPINSATGVAINKTVKATFSEAMNPATISTANFLLIGPGTTPVTGTVAYDVVSMSATFTPIGNLAANTVYVATITTGAKDLANNPVLSNFPWSFTTSATPDTTAPTVSATVPVAAATGVAINQTVKATFSEAMDPATISTANFLLIGPGATPVTGTVAYDVVSMSATFTPVSNLAANTVYMATITTGAKDLANNPLVSNFAWSFTTTGTTTGQAPVVLGSASTFAVLAGSTVTSTGGTMVNGDLGISPGTALTGAPTVTGTTHLGDPAAAQAQLDLTTAYNDAAGRTVGAITVAGNLGGQTLTPGLYKSTSSLEISSGDLTLDAQGDANAVFIFQMGSTLTTTVGRQVILSGGAQAANIVWQVGSSATLGTTSVMKGNILALASITVTTGAAVEGRLLARNGAVTLDANTVGLGTTGDTTPPTVSSTDPINSATGVAINKTVKATFSEAMDPATIRTTNFLLIGPGTTPVTGTVAYNVVSKSATFTPVGNLAANTVYVATITTGAKDLAGNPLLISFAWSFTTGATPDTNRPTVSSTDPVNSASGVAINQTINATFSEAMDPATISTANFLLIGPGTTPVTGTVAYDVVSMSATFTPVSKLAANTVYVATITTGAKDLAGNSLLINFGWSFTTVATTAGQAPVVLGSASTFAVLAGSTVTSTGGTTVNGDLGLSPGTAVTGFPPGVVNGPIHAGDAAAAQAQLDLTTAYNDAAGRTVGAITVAGNLGGQTLTPGLYKSTSSLAISSGDLTLDAQGDANAVFIFQMGSTLTTTAGRQVILSGGAQAVNIVWQVGSSATLGTTSGFKGNILALTSITVTTGAAVEGRLLARNGAVTLDANTITIPTATSSVVLQSAAAVTGPFTDAAGQVVNLATRTITVPLSGSMKFYRLRSNGVLTITSILIYAGDVVITYN